MTPEEFQTGLNTILDDTQPKGVNGSKGITKAIFKSIGTVFKNLLASVNASNTTAQAAATSATLANEQIAETLGATSIVREIASTNAIVGPLNPFYFLFRGNHKLYPDEEFSEGVNGMVVYGGPGITLTRLTSQPGVPNRYRNVLKFAYTGGTSVGYGGFMHPIRMRYNAVFVQVFKALLPAGYKFNITHNFLGTGGSVKFLTKDTGTGKWEEYAVLIQTGHTGTISDDNDYGAGHIYVDGGPNIAMEWGLASATVFDLTKKPVDYAVREIQLQPNGTSVVFNLRRPYKFTWAIVYSDAVTVNAQPANTVNANTDALLTLTGTAGKTLTISVQQTL